MGRPLNIFVGRIGAASDKRNRYLIGIIFFFYLSRHGRDGPCQVRCERPHHMGLQGGEINLYHLVIIFFRIRFDLRIGLKMVAQRFRQIRYGTSACGPEVSGHAVIKRKEGRGGANLSPHIANSPFTRTGNGPCPVTEIFHDPAGATFHRHDSRQFQDHILW